MTALLHRQLLDEEEDREEDGFESDSFGRTPSFSRRRHSMSGVLTETPSSETNDLPLDQGDEGPGSVRWSLKEHIRTEVRRAVGHTASQSAWVAP